MTEPTPTPSPQPPPTPEPTPAPTPAAATRPDYMPEQFWDAQSGGIKVEDFGKHYTDITGKATKFDEAETARAAITSRKLEDIKVEPKLAADVKVPEGVKAQFSEKDPIVQGFRALAHEAQLPQDVVDRLVTFRAKWLIDDHNAELARVAEETKKLGDKAADRQAAVTNWAKGLKDAGKITAEEHAELVATGSTAAGVTLIEAFIKLVNGGVPGNAAPRDPTPEPVSQQQRWYPDMNRKVS